MSISDYIKPAMTAVVAKKDGEIKAVLDEFSPGWTLVDIKQRCQLVRVHGSPVETLYMDGVPLLEIHPPEFHEPVLEGDRYIVRITQNFRRLPVTVSCDAEERIEQAPDRVNGPGASASRGPTSADPR